MKTPLCKTTTSNAAHYLTDSRETATGIICDVQLIGAVLPYSVPLAEVSEYTPAPIAANLDPITRAAQTAVIKFKTDPKRTQKASAIVRAGNNIFARANHAVIKSEAFESNKNTYEVSKGLCTCEDHKRTHGLTVCKHRIALYIYNQINPTQGAPRAYFEKQFCGECMQVHFLEIPPYGLDPVCHGLHYIPTADSAHYVRRSGRGYEVIAYTSPVNMHAAVNAAKG
jgi:hypothetical protein